MLTTKQIAKSTAKEKAHLQSAPPTPKPKSAKELLPSLFSPPPKKNKFPTPTPAYFQTNRIKAQHITVVTVAQLLFFRK